MRAKDITLIALFTAIIFTQEQILSFLPNIQLTVFLLVLYSRLLGFKKTLIIIFIHVILDNLMMGSAQLIIPMFIGWIFIPLTLSTIFKSFQNIYVLSSLGILYAFFYSWILLIYNVLFLKISFIVYFTQDVIYEVILALSSFLTILWLYKPVINKLHQITVSDPQSL